MRPQVLLREVSPARDIEWKAMDISVLSKVHGADAPSASNKCQECFHVAVNPFLYDPGGKLKGVFFTLWMRAGEL